MPQGETGLTLSSAGCTGSARARSTAFHRHGLISEDPGNSPAEQRLCVHVYVCMEGQTDGVPLCSNGVYTRGNELAASPVTVCRHRPAAVCSLSTNSSAKRCFLNAMQASLLCCKREYFPGHYPCPSPYPWVS